MATAPATTRLPNIKGWVYDDEDSYCRVEDEEAREMVTDAYDPTATYTQGATCIQDNKLYRAKADITTAEVWTPDHWEGTSLEQIRKDMETEISTLNAKIPYPVYTTRNDIFTTNKKVDNQLFTFNQDCYVVAFARTQGTSGSGFIRVMASNNTTIFEAYGITGVYQYIWSPPLFVKSGASLKFLIEISPSSVTDGQIGIGYFPVSGS